ncbi:choice-of-anchor J domain-containing protein [Flavobacterium enshiense]|uniref:T9SS-dependent choice-of-anchor J family protein n=1 Tax=Flavobacterium enshiense TaxID=1341165 RepID=UPI00345C7CD4
MRKITLLVALLLMVFCSGYSQFNESFESGIPSTWTVINGGDSNTWEVTSSSHSGSNGVRIYYSYESHDDYLVTQQFTVTAGVSDRLSLWARNLYSSYPEPFDILVSTTGNNAADFTNTIAAQVSPPDYAWQKYTYSLNAYVGQTIFIAFHTTTTNMYELFIDDISVDTDPVAPPACVTNPVSVINPSCGNFASTISWNLAPDADGYYLTVGTTPGGTNVINNQDMGMINSYTLNDQVPNTTYYWKAVAYNVIGPTVGCVENSYTTAAVPCFCTPNPSSVDNLGITGVSIGTINNTTGAESGNYGDYSNMITDVYRGLPNPFSITYETGFTYDTKIWVDWNNDYDFDDAGEEVYSGVSGDAMPTTLSGSFFVPPTASLGNHRMRIGGQDNGPAVPCYTWDYGSFEDYTINVILPNCSPAVAIPSIVPDCSTQQYFIQANVIDLGSGTPYISDGVNTWPIAAVGNVQIGPFSFGTLTTLMLHNGVNSICDMPLGTFNFLGCPPANDDCANAIPLTPGATYSEYITDGTNLEASASNEAGTTCFGSVGGDVWYSVVVPASGSITIETGATSSGDAPYFDSVIAIYSGVCGSLTHVDCDDDSADTGNYSLKTVSGLTPGSTLYISVAEYYNDYVASFGISAYDTSLLNTVSFDDKGLLIYPNPTKDILNISYRTAISKVSILNLLGQEILKININATQSQIDISSLANGTYLVKAETTNGVKTVKIVKAN